MFGETSHFWTFHNLRGQLRGLIVLYIIFVSIRLGIQHKIQFWRPGIYFFFSVPAFFWRKRLTPLAMHITLGGGGSTSQPCLETLENHGNPLFFIDFP